MNNSTTAARVYASIRILIGFFMLYHGLEVFDATKISEYAQWDVFKPYSQAYWIPFLGKASEFVSGFLLMIGFKTKWAAVFLAGTMLFICFFIGHGKFWYEDQHPFLFALFGIQYFFMGAGIWSIDNRQKTTPK